MRSGACGRSRTPSRLGSGERPRAKPCPGSSSGTGEPTFITSRGARTRPPSPRAIACRSTRPKRRRGQGTAREGIVILGKANSAARTASLLPDLDRVALQERQGLLVEFLHLLIDRRMRTPFKDQQFGAANWGRHPGCETRRRHQIVATEGNLRGRRDPTQLASASWAITAFDSWRKAGTGCAGRPRTNSAKDWIYSGRAAYSSGVKHHGKIPRMTISGTLPSAGR